MALRNVLSLMLLAAVTHAAQDVMPTALGPLGGSLKLSYKDCGDASTHAKITGLSPSTARIGKKVTITGTGDLDKDITDGTFKMETAFSKGVPLLDCQGDASVEKKCNFPLLSGSLSFEGVNFPIKAGPQDINVDLYLSPLLSATAGLILTTTEVTAVSNSGDKIFCMKVITGKSNQNGMVSLSYEDCGDSETHAKITGLTPSSVTIGKKTKITGTGMLDKDIADGNFRAQTFFSGGDLADCSGDAGKEQKCGLLGGTLGSLTFDALSFPIKKGSNSVSVDLSLNPLIPAALAQTVTTVTASTKGGDKIFCMEVSTAPVSGADMGIQLGDGIENGNVLSALNDYVSNVISGNNNSYGYNNGVNVDVNVFGIQEKDNAESAHVDIDGDDNMNGHDNGVNVDVNVYGVQVNKDTENVRSMPKALSSPTPNNVNAASALVGNENFNGHDNGVNVNVNVLGIQDKENVESDNGGSIRGDKNMNGHDNGVNVNVNVLGIQKKGNVESANVTMGGDGKLAMGEIANILTLLRSLFGGGTNSSGMVVV